MLAVIQRVGRPPQSVGDGVLQGLSWCFGRVPGEVWLTLLFLVGLAVVLGVAAVFGPMWRMGRRH